MQEVDVMVEWKLKKALKKKKRKCTDELRALEKIFVSDFKLESSSSSSSEVGETTK